jgi:hypothetical protein
MLKNILKPSSKPLHTLALIIDNPLFNVIWFNLFWFLAVAGRESMLPVSLGLLLIHFALVENISRECFQVTVVALIGAGVDLMLSAYGYYIFADNKLLPAWLFCLWVAFAISLSRSLFIFTKFPALAIIFGAIGGSMSYLGGHHLGAVSFSKSLFMTTVIIACIWAVLFPLLLLITKKIQEHEL